MSTLAIAPHPDLYHRLADLRERMGRPDEATAWHRLVLKDDPNDALSRAAVDRLATQKTDTGSKQNQMPVRR